MCTRATNTEKRVRLRSAWFLGIVIILMYSPAVWASTRFAGGDVEVQAWYRMRQTFQTDEKHFDWVGWRNEAFVWLIDNNLVKHGYLFDRVPIPLVEHAALSARFRARVDPVYYLREHYRKLYDANLRSDFFAPEKDFRDLYIDLDHGQVGPGDLSTRIGYQQIVWGETDLFRSLDVINPLRLDQTFAVGEKFDEFRLPILAIKFLYRLGNVGESLSEMSFEGWYTPRYRGVNSNSHVIVEEGWRIPFQEKGCLGPNNELLDYRPENCANSRRFLPYRPGWLGSRRTMNPWSLLNIGPSSRRTSPDFICVTRRCAPDVPGDRISLLYNLAKGRGRHHTRGTDPGQWSAGGVRLIGKTWFGLDFSLNYIFQPSGPWGSANPHTRVKVFGDSPAPAFLGGGQPQGTFEEGLLRCLSPSGKTNVGRNGQTNESTILTGADLRGYDWPQRRLDAKGNPLPTAKQKQAARPLVTFCAGNIQHIYKWSHVVGFTATYNDYNYTGAVFRLEESIDTNEVRNKFTVTKSHPHAIINMPVWRHALGMDLFQALEHYPGMGWMRHLPGQMGTQQSAVILQWIMEYLPEVSNDTCPWDGAPGSKGSLPAEEPPHRDPIRRCQEKHWNHIFTLGTGGIFFRGKLEQRLAAVYEPRQRQTLLYGQWWWREFLSTPIDLSMGVSWFPGSINKNGWSKLDWFAHRDLLWFEATYYLL